MKYRLAPSYRIVDRSKPDANSPNVFYYTVIDTASRRNRKMRFRVVRLPHPATAEDLMAVANDPETHPRSEDSFHATFELIDDQNHPLGTLGPKQGYIVYDNETCEGWVYATE